MLEVRCATAIEAARAFADTLPRKDDGKFDKYKVPRESLEHCLSRYEDDDNKLVVIMEDSHIKHSFYFHVYTLVGNSDQPDTRGLGGHGENYFKDGKEWKYWYNGGYIFADYSNNWSVNT